MPIRFKMFHYVVGLISGIRGFSREPRGRSGRFATGSRHSIPDAIWTGALCCLHAIEKSMRLYYSIIEYDPCCSSASSAYARTG
jgi:hypothetical protein